MCFRRRDGPNGNTSLTVNFCFITGRTLKLQVYTKEKDQLPKFRLVVPLPYNSLVEKENKFLLKIYKLSFKENYRDPCKVFRMNLVTPSSLLDRFFSLE